MSRRKRNLRLEWIEPDQLTEHPENWKTHPDPQVDGLESVIGKVGWAGALLYNETTGRLLDGHARKKLDPKLLVNGKVPVLVGSWAEDDERLILATLDPLGSMAEANDAALNELLAQLEAETPQMQALLDALAKEELLPDKESDEPDLTDTDFSYQSQFGVIVMCDDEAHQERVYEELKGHGYNCKVVVT